MSKTLLGEILIGVAFGALAVAMLLPSLPQSRRNPLTVWAIVLVSIALVSIGHRLWLKRRSRSRF